MIVNDFNTRDLIRLTRDVDGLLYHILIGPHGAVQFVWMPQFVSQLEAFGVDLSCHHREPPEGEYESRKCDLLAGQDFCYWTTSALAGLDLMQLWGQRGREPEWIWTTLCMYYQCRLVKRPFDQESTKDA